MSTPARAGNARPVHRRNMLIGGSALLLGAMMPLSPAVAAPYQLQRYGGANRYAVAAATTAEMQQWSGGIDVVYIASGELWSDGLTAGPAAQADPDLSGALLLTQKNVLPKETAAALAELRPRTIVVVGSTGTISAGVEQQLRKYASSTVLRVAGKDRYEVSANLSKRSTPRPTGDTVYLAGGTVFADALSGAGAAAAMKRSVLLTAPTTLPPSVAAELKRLKPKRVVVLGGPSTVSDKVLGQVRQIARADRIGGKDRYEVSAALIRDIDRDMKASSGGDSLIRSTVIVNGTNFPDALSATNITAGGVLLVQPTSLPAPAVKLLNELPVDSVKIVGGPSSVSVAVEKRVEGLIDKWDLWG